MFNLREYIKKGFLNAVGKMADYQIILNSTGYFEKGVLTEEDLAEINTAIEKQYVVDEVIEEVDMAEEVIEEVVEEMIETPVEETPVEESGDE